MYLNRIIFKLTLSVLFLTGLGCSPTQSPDVPLVIGGLTMGTTYTVKINAGDHEQSEQQLGIDITRILKEVNDSMSTYLEDSELSRLNKNGNDQWLSISGDLSFVLQQAMAISDLTAGKFDFTVGPLVNLWGFGPSDKAITIPDEFIIAEMLDLIGYQHIQLNKDENTIRKNNPDIYIDLSAIAKGFAVDKLANYLESHDINNYMVEIGGEIRAKGVNEIGFSWRIGIEKPIGDTRKVQRVIKLDNIAMATSGDYRNYFEIDGKRFSHTIDPITGYPVSHSLASVTVLDVSATRADALATAFLVMGKEAAYELAEREKIAALFLERQGAEITESYSMPMAQYFLNPVQESN